MGRSQGPRSERRRESRQGIEGVEQVDNQIEVLPPSPMDDNCGRRLYRAIYGFPACRGIRWRAATDSYHSEVPAV